MKNLRPLLAVGVGRDLLIGFFVGGLSALVVLSMRDESGLVLVPLLAVLLIAASAIAWRRLRQIADVATIASTIGPNTLDLRLPEHDLPIEVLPIVHGVNGALERLERAVEGEREFLRRAAHQLRTPMTVLNARLETLDDHETAAMLRSDVRALARIVSQLLQLYEIDALVHRDDAVADLGAVGEAVVVTMAGAAEKQGNRIMLDQPETPVLARGDPNVIELALRNLVENAMQHSPPGSTISLRVGADARLDVIDPGPGVASELNDKIFEPFWSSNLAGGGAGLGLTIVRRVAERYGATVNVAPAPHQGAVFSIHFAATMVRHSDLDETTAKSVLPWTIRRRHRTIARKAT